MKASMRATGQALAVVLAGTMLASCGGTNDSAPPPQSQVVARIGPDVITIQELDNEFRLSNVQADRRKDPEVIRKAITELVTRKMLARRALTAKLDREPTVLLDLLRAKDLVLAEASTSRAINAKISGLSKDDIDRYISVNPIKFANRQILQVDQLITPISNLSSSIIDAARSAKSLNDVGQILTGSTIPFSRSSGVINTAEMPDDLAASIRTQGLEGIFFVRAGSNAGFLKVVGQEARPLTGSAADSYARQLIRVDLSKSEASLAAFTANLEATYVGDYAKIMNVK